MIQLSVQISAKEESPDTHCSIGIVNMEAPISVAEIEGAAEVVTVIGLFSMKGEGKPAFLTNEQWKIVQEDTVKTMSKIGLMLMEHIDRYTAEGG